MGQLKDFLTGENNCEHNHWPEENIAHVREFPEECKGNVTREHGDEYRVKNETEEKEFSYSQPFEIEKTLTQWMLEYVTLANFHETKHQIDLDIIPKKNQRPGEILYSILQKKLLISRKLFGFFNSIFKVLTN